MPKSDTNPITGRALATRLDDPFDAVAETFSQPPIWFAPHAFYFMTGDIAATDLCGQAAALCAKRLNPGYFQMRQWPNGYFVTDKWFDGIRKTLEATSEAGGYACYTGGDPCVPERQIREHCPDLWVQSLRWDVLAPEAGATVTLSDCLFAVEAQLCDGLILPETLAIVESGDWLVPEGEWRLYKFNKYRQREPEGLELNFLDRRVGDAWIVVEHEKYAARVGEFMGNVMPGAFIDLEGDYGTKLAYSDDLAAQYLARTGRNLRLWLPLLIDEDAGGVWMKARWEWFKSVSEVYLDSLIRPLDRWFEKHDMYMTCHFWEENLVAQAMRTGDYFAAQRSYSLPGTDSLFMGALRPRDFKETQAVSEFERRQNMCELLGVAGWHVSAAVLKNATNHAIAWGVTQVVPHGIGSNRDLRSVSYPPDFFDWNPYWSYFEQYTDYTRRASFVNAQGHLAADTLLLCPMDSVWSLLGDGLFDADKPYKTFTVDQRSGIGDPEAIQDARHGDEINVIERSYSAAMNEMSAHRIEYMPVDCEYVRQLTLEGAALVRDGYAFRTIVLPPLASLPIDIAEKLAAFASAGGHVVTLGALPRASTNHGANCIYLAALMRDLSAAPNTVAAPNGLAALIENAHPALRPQVSFVSGEFPLIQQHRRIDGRDFYWLVNATHEPQHATICLNGVGGGLTRWDCETGGQSDVWSEHTPAGTECDVPFAPYEAFWLVADSGKPINDVLSNRRPWTFDELPNSWRVSFDPTGQPDPAQHSQAVPDWLLNGGEIRPLDSWLNWGLRSFTGFIDYETEVDGSDDSAYIDLGEVKHMAELFVNDKRVGAKLWAPYEFDITTYLQPGHNTIRVRVGNLLLNAITQYEGYDWKWYDPPTDDQLDCGLYGPITLHREL